MIVSGERTGEHQRTQKNKVGAGEFVHPSHDASSQKDIIINEEKDTSLFTSSQKDVGIENSHPSKDTKKGEGHF